MSPMDMNSPASHVPEIAVLVQNGCKSYSKGSYILNNLNMTVSRGSIYGLLGASGCGKTTILSCIVGLRKMDSGEIKVFGYKPGTRESGIPGRRLGYMPQDIALYPHLTIREFLQYFGTIYGLSHLEILSRINFFATFLHLPDSSRRINTLSGGQQRRVSLGTALVGEPELLILDEPTVGVDPLLRENIWNYLVQITNMGKTTVIITTHYIEEARQAHRVGLMRNGKLLIEDSPDTLMKKYKATLLEDVVLRLCRRDMVNISMTNDSVNSGSTKISSPSKRKLSKIKGEANFSSMENIVGLKYRRRYSIMAEESCTSKPRRSIMKDLLENAKARRNRIRALILRNFISFIRNPVFCVGILLLPVFCSVITAASVGHNVKNMKIGVVNEELPNWKEVCTSDNHNGSKSKSLENFSCLFLNTLPAEIFTLVSFATRESALNDVHEGKLWGILTFPVGYSENFALRVISGKHASNETIEGSAVTVQLDQSNFIASFLMIGKMYESFEAYAMRLAAENDQNPFEFKLPLECREPVYGSLGAGYQEHIIPPAMAIIIFLASMGSCSLNYIYDKNMGTMDRSGCAGVQVSDLLVAYFITEGLAIVIETLLTVAILVAFFGFKVNGSYFFYALLCVLVGLVGQTWGFIIGVIVKDDTSAFLIELLIFQQLMTLTGITWPLESVPECLRYFCYSLPLTLAADSLRSLTTRGLGIIHPLVWPGFAAVIAWILISSLIAVVIYRLLN